MSGHGRRPGWHCHRRGTACRSADRFGFGWLVNSEQAFPGEGPITGGPKCTVEPTIADRGDAHRSGQEGRTAVPAGKERRESQRLPTGEVAAVDPHHGRIAAPHLIWVQIGKADQGRGNSYRRLTSSLQRQCPIRVAASSPAGRTRLRSFHAAKTRRLPALVRRCDRRLRLATGEILLRARRVHIDPNDGVAAPKNASAVGPCGPNNQPCAPAESALSNLTCDSTFWLTTDVFPEPAANAEGTKANTARTPTAKRRLIRPTPRPARPGARRVHPRQSIDAQTLRLPRAKRQPVQVSGIEQ